MKTYEACLGEETMKGVAFLPILKQEEENYKVIPSWEIYKSFGIC